MRIILSFIIIFSLGVGFSAEAAVQKKQKGRAYSIQDLIYDCTKCSTDEKSSECIYCNGLLTGAASTLAMFEIKKSFCPPANLDTHLTRNMFRRWAKDHPAKDDPAVAGIIASLQSSFPCKNPPAAQTPQP